MTMDKATKQVPLPMEAEINASPVDDFHPPFTITLSVGVVILFVGFLVPSARATQQPASFQLSERRYSQHS